MFTQRHRTHKLLVLFMTLLVSSVPCKAGKYETSSGLGFSFYTGKTASALAPGYALLFSTSGNYLGTKFFNVVNRFTLEILSGQDFAGQYGSFFGIGGNYQMGGRFNFSKENIIPFLELGPMIGLYGLMLSSDAGDTTKNQASLKYGYTIGVGFDKFGAGMKRGDGSGWGVVVHYFSLMKSPSLFEFPAKSLTANGVKFEIIFVSPPK
jgi:hypothetical protein